MSRRASPGGWAEQPDGADAVLERIRRGDASLREAEDWYLRRVFHDHDGNYAAAARKLGIDRTTLKRRLKSAVIPPTTMSTSKP